MRNPLLLISAGTGALSALAGLVFEILGGLIAWTIFRGVHGMLFAAMIGGLTAWLIRRATPWPASSIAGSIGAFVAAWFAIATMEVYAPGSLEWALKGGLYGAAWGLSVGAILGPIALLRRGHQGT